MSPFVLPAVAALSFPSSTSVVNGRLQNRFLPVLRPRPCQRTRQMFSTRPALSLARQSSESRKGKYNCCEESNIFTLEREKSFMSSMRTRSVGESTQVTLGMAGSATAGSCTRQPECRSALPPEVHKADTHLGGHGEPVPGVGIGSESS